MRIFYSIITLCLALAVAQPVHAAVSGAELLSRCEAAQKSIEGASLTGAEMLDGMWCMGYMGGLLDGFGVGDFRIGNEKAVCPPGEGLTREQALRSVTRWLRENPDALQKSGRRGAILALSRTYPCR
jgi:hypothetical protein